MVTQYFSDRELGQMPRAVSEISPNVWQGIAWLIQERVENGSFGQRFPEKCQDYPHHSSVCYGTNIGQFEAAIKVAIPALAEIEQIWRDQENQAAYGFFRPDGKNLWEMSTMEQPPLMVVMDIIEFCWQNVSKSEQGQFHSFFQHWHLRFDKIAGQSEFRNEVNFVFQRNGVEFDLTEQGSIERLVPGPVGSALRSAVPQTGDAELDQLLETARRKILVPDENEHRDALEKLWDAWERLKTVEGEDSDKKSTKVKKLLDKSADPSQVQFRTLIESEARALTDAGNSFRIRHSETTQERLEASEQVDYLFQRMFSLIHFILRSTGRGARMLAPRHDIPMAI